MFITKVGAILTVKKLIGASLAGGPVGFVFVFFLEKILSFAVSQGILKLDLGLVGIKMGMEEREFRSEIVKAYNKAMKRKYSRAEKDQIHAEFKSVMRKFVRVRGANGT